MMAGWLSRFLPQVLRQDVARLATQAPRLVSLRRRGDDDALARPEEMLLDEGFLRRLERLNLLARERVSTTFPGEHRGRRRASSVEFADYRPYSPGDDPRRIDWNLYGRLGELAIKLTESQERLDLHLLLDCSPSMRWGGSPSETSKLHYARQIVAALGYLGLSRFDSVEILLFSGAEAEVTTLSRGKGQAMALLSFLNRNRVLQIDRMPPGNARTGADIEATLRLYAERAMARRTAQSRVAVLVSDLFSPAGPEEGANYGAGVVRGIEHLLRGRFEVTVLHLLHAEEARPTLGGELELIDSETGEIVEITIGEDAIRAYTERVERWQSWLGRELAPRGVSYLPIDTSLSLETLVLDRLRQRRLVR